MFSSIIRLGVAVSSAVILSSCGGGSSSVAETQQSTPEGLFTGTNSLNQTMLVFVIATGSYYAFYSEPNTPTVLEGAQEGTYVFSGGTMTAVDTEDLNLQNNTVTNPSFAGAYNTGVNIAGTLSYPLSGATVTYNLNYNIGYQGIQDLGTLAGAYTGTVGLSSKSEPATFTFGTATSPANSGNQFGVATVTGTSASGCAYTGTVSPLFKGNGYTITLTSGGSPCLLPNTQFSGLVYLDTTTNRLYSFAPDAARSDGIIFVGTRA